MYVRKRSHTHLIKSGRTSSSWKRESLSAFSTSWVSDWVQSRVVANCTESLSDSVYWLYDSIGIRDLAKHSDQETGLGGANTSGSCCCKLDIPCTIPPSVNELALEENTFNIGRLKILCLFHCLFPFLTTHKELQHILQVERGLLQCQQWLENIENFTSTWLKNVCNSV